MTDDMFYIRDRQTGELRGPMEDEHAAHKTATSHWPTWEVVTVTYTPVVPDEIKAVAAALQAAEDAGFMPFIAVQDERIGFASKEGHMFTIRSNEEEQTWKVGTK